MSSLMSDVPKRRATCARSVEFTTRSLVTLGQKMPGEENRSTAMSAQPDCEHWQASMRTPLPLTRCSWPPSKLWTPPDSGPVGAPMTVERA